MDKYIETKKSKAFLGIPTFHIPMQLLYISFFFFFTLYLSYDLLNSDEYTIANTDSVFSIADEKI